MPLLPRIKIDYWRRSVVTEDHANPLTHFLNSCTRFRELLSSNLLVLPAHERRMLTVEEDEDGVAWWRQA